MSDVQSGGQEEAPAKRGQAYFNEAAAEVAKRNAEAQRLARERRKEADRKRLITVREAERRDMEEAVKKTGRGR